MAARKRSTRKSSSKGRRSTPKRRGPSTAQRFLSELTPERRVDIIGVVMALAGGLTVLTLVSGQPGGLGEAWLNFLKRGFGWGVYLLPLGLLVLGLWLVLRHVERVPALNLQRILGGLLVYWNLLAWLHVATFPESAAAARTLAEQGLGGGSLGAGSMLWLRAGLGTAGMAIALLTWLLIGLTLMLDVSVVGLFGWLQPLLWRIQDWWAELRVDGSGEDEGVMFERAALDEQEFQPVHPEAPEAAKTLVDEDGPLPEIDENGVGADKPAWALPVLTEMLDLGAELSYDRDLNKQRATLIEETLASFGAPATVVEINRGPTITQFGVEPDFVETRNGRTRVRVAKISSLADDLALALAASRIRVQAPVPGKGYVGIEVPNEEQSVVALRDVMESEAFKRLRSPLRFALGKDVAGQAVAADLAAMPHLLIAGATGSGKSVSVNALICGLLLNNTPETLRMLMIDPKRVELTGYNGIPHLMAPVIVEIERVVGFLQWVTHEMDKRYRCFSKVGARHIVDFNQRMQQEGQDKLPYLVVVIDELADLMMVAPDQTEKLITRMAQLARATGIHLVISTQRPSVDVVTGLIKANFPARIAFAVASGTDSRVILDQAGAERLLGRGDMLFHAPDAPNAVRLQGVFLAESEIFRIVNYWRGFAGSADSSQMANQARPSDGPPAGVPLKQIPIWEEVKEFQEQEELDEMFDECVDLVRRRGRASISMLQRRLRIGYTRAARIVEQMERRGIIGPPQGGAHHREILYYGAKSDV
ncbi:MAG: DUF87 domain-containing protein [Chloroflexi bacterium]|nr:DUF87 domain-containing protein [Chloroflexota bacterium]